jgi:HSP20 family molecular chaperone IbpA
MELAMNYIFDQVARDMAAFTNKQSFPHYNIVKIHESCMEIQIALAGYKMGDIKIEQQGENLSISSNGVNDKDVEYYHKGFTTKPFVRTFLLNNEVEVKGADFQGGILTIFLDRIIPEKMKVRTIPIGKQNQQILNG